MKQQLDVSTLPAPEPLTRILDTLADMPEEDWLSVRHSRNPQPLYSMLRGMQYCWQTVELASDHFEILIWPASWGLDPPADSDRTPKA